MHEDERSHKNGPKTQNSKDFLESFPVETHDLNQTKELLAVLELEDSYEKFSKLAVLNPSDYRSWNYFKRILLEMIENSQEVEGCLAKDLLISYHASLCDCPMSKNHSGTVEDDLSKASKHSNESCSSESSVELKTASSLSKTTSSIKKSLQTFQRILSSITGFIKDSASLLINQDSPYQDSQRKRIKIENQNSNKSGSCRWYEDIPNIERSVKYLPDDIENFIKDQLLLTQEALSVDPKSYAAWHHRAQMFGIYKKEWYKDHQLCNLLLKIDQRNFHCWNYCLINRFKVRFDINNYSSYNYNLKLNQRIGPNVSALKHYVRRALFLDPEQRGPWDLYQYIFSSENSFGIIKYHKNKGEIIFNEVFQGTVSFIACDAGGFLSNANTDSEVCVICSDSTQKYHGFPSDSYLIKNKSEINKAEVDPHYGHISNTCVVHNFDPNHLCYQCNKDISRKGIHVEASTLEKISKCDKSNKNLTNKPLAHNINLNVSHEILTSDNQKLFKDTIKCSLPTRKVAFSDINLDKCKVVEINNNIFHLERLNMPKLVDEILELEPTCISALQIKLKYTIGLSERKALIQKLIAADTLRERYYNSLLYNTGEYYKIKLENNEY